MDKTEKIYYDDQFLEIMDKINNLLSAYGLKIELKEEESDGVEEIFIQRIEKQDG